MPQVRAILFDVDGVLVDAADWHFEALNRALLPFQVTISHKEHEEEFLGLTSATKLNRLVQRGLLPSEACLTVLKSKRSYFNNILRERCVPDVERVALLAELRTCGLLLAAVSNAMRDSVLEMLARSGLQSYFDAIICGDDVRSPKPDPQPYLACMKMLNVAPEECLALEDGRYGVQAARSAGVRVLEINDFADVTLVNIRAALADPLTSSREIAT